MEIQRPRPEKLLKEIEEEKNMKTRGKLKIFFGYAAGVGKTYSMLKAAKKIKKSGIDVVCGYIENHARLETMRLVDGFEVVPVKEFEYNGIVLKEMDLDAVLLRKPELVLIDEYAHTNAKGSRHDKRYQDIKEILNAGIDVYTTVNVQHIESLCDTIASITGIIVRERIPDRAFDLADEIQLVDIEPKELLERLKEGKIYREVQAQRAMKNFFSEENLTALREIALRRTADRVNINTEKAKRLSKNQYYTEEKILVGISASPSNPKIIRAASRMAQAFGGEFIGLFVETSEFGNMSNENIKRLKNNIHLAQKLGAEIETVCGDDIAFTISEYVKISGISKVVVGRSNVKEGIFLKTSFIDKLTFSAPDTEIYVIPDSDVQKISIKSKNKNKEKVRGIDLLKSIGILLGCTIIGFLFYNLGFSDTNIITIYILGVMLSAILTSNKLYSMILSIISVITFNYFFTKPLYSLQTYDPSYLVTFIIMFLSSFISSTLARKIKNQAREFAKIAYRTKVLLDTTQLLQKEKDIDDIAKIACIQLTKLLDKDIIFYKAGRNGLESPVVNRCENSSYSDECISDSEKAVAAWVFKNNKHAGATTGTLGDSECYYLSVRNLNDVYGVIGIKIKQGDILEVFERDLLFAILAETAEVMEKEILRRKQEDAIQRANNEKLRANLLRSISHDLRTPLTSISGSAYMMSENELDIDVRKKMCRDIYDDSMWLISLVENLLSVTRIEDGTMKLNKQAEMLEDIILEALKHVNRKSNQYFIKVKMEDEMQLVKVDSRLIIQVITNIVDNAIKYTPIGSSIMILTQKKGKIVIVDICDDGPGIPDENKEHIFEMFYTANKKIADSRRSLGLGLTLCKSVISAHGGEISVMDNKPKGTIFRFTLQAEEVEIHE